MTRRTGDLPKRQSTALQRRWGVRQVRLVAGCCSVIAIIVVVRRRGPNSKLLCCLLAHLSGSATEAGEHLYRLPTGGEAEPSPPSQVCLGCAFTQPLPELLRYGAGLARQTFASRLYLRQRVELLKATPQCSISLAPWWLVPRQRERQLRHHRSPSSVTGRPSPPGGIARGRWRVRHCIKVYASPVSMKCISKMSALKGAILNGERRNEQRI